LKAHPEIVAVDEYGIPEVQANKLVGMDVNFEKVTENVDGVLVTSNETGADAFYFDLQTEIFVAVDRWPVVTEVERIRENQMTQEELFSDEYFAWLKYLASKLEFDPKKIKTNVPVITAASPNFRELIYGVKTLPNFADPETAPFRNKETMAYLELPDSEELSYGGVPIVYASMPNFYLVNEGVGEEYDWRVYPVILTQSGTDDGADYGLDNLLEIWQKHMNITPILTDHPIHGRPQEYPSLLVAQTYKEYGDSTVEAALSTFGEDEDPRKMSKPGFVLDVRPIFREKDVDWYQ